FPTSGRATRLSFLDAPAGSEVRISYGRQLIAYTRTERPAREWVVDCPDIADEVDVAAPRARLVRLSWIRVPGDLRGWQPLANVPPVGKAPLDRAGIAARLG